jgi:hypothetical protein
MLETFLSETRDRAKTRLKKKKRNLSLFGNWWVSKKQKSTVDLTESEDLTTLLLELKKILLILLDMIAESSNETLF